MVRVHSDPPLDLKLLAFVYFIIFVAMKKYLMPLLAALLLSSCASQTFLVNSANNVDYFSLDSDEPSHFFINGVGQYDIIDAVAICGSAEQVYKVETQVTFANGLLSFFTLGIYTPYQYRVYCVSASPS